MRTWLKATLIAVPIAALMATCFSGPSGPDPSDKIKVRGDLLQLTLDNQTGERWTECDWTLNGDYEYGADLERGEAGYPFRAFADDAGTRFEPLRMKPRRLHIHCRQPRTLTVYRTWD